MLKPNVLILRAPGTNCDQESGYAFETAGAQCEYVHINQLIESPNQISNHQILCLPGGFSYGDDIGAGRILASQMKARLADVIHEFREQGKLILGICNGFQILIKTGFLLPRDDQGLPATLSWNDSGRFTDCWVNLAVKSEKCVFLNGVKEMYLPIAHAEGKFVPRDQTVMDQLAANEQLALTYFNPDSPDGPVEFPHNPNGSTGNVAGVCDETGRVFGLMPHPERHIDATHHPRWTRRENSGGLAVAGDGLAVFENAVQYFT